MSAEVRVSFRTVAERVADRLWARCGESLRGLPDAEMRARVSAIAAAFAPTPAEEAAILARIAERLREEARPTAGQRGRSPIIRVEDDGKGLFDAE